MSKSTPFRQEFVQCISPEGLHTMAYKDWGDINNPNVVVCVHGVTRISGDFDDLAHSLSSQYRVICPDIVGRGKSSWFNNPQHYHVPQYVSDIVTLLARINVPKVNYIGTSMGGLIAMGLGALPNNPIKKLILNDIGPVLNTDALIRIGEYIGKPMRFATYAEGAAYIRSICATFGEHTEAQWHKLCDDVLRQDTDGMWIRHYDLAIAHSMKAFNADVAQVMQTILWQSYDAITCPTLLMRGANSDLLSHDSAMAMTQRGPQAKLIEFANVGHAPTMINEEQIQVVKDFLTA